MKKMVEAFVVKNEQLVGNSYDMVLLAPEIAAMAKAGQFIDLYTGKGEMLLPRPISLCEIDGEKGTLRLVYQAVGTGTSYFTTLQKGDSIQIVGPLGSGFSVEEGHRKHILVGGGIGVPPLLELAKQLKGEIHVYIGARSNPILIDDFKKLGATVSVATDDGSVGLHGTVLDVMAKKDLTGDMVYACGPKVMLQAVAKWAEVHQIPAQISMEERMACGIGACVGCAVKIKKAGTEDWEHLKVCKDGPVFWGNEVVWDEK